MKKTFGAMRAMGLAIISLLHSKENQVKLEFVKFCGERDGAYQNPRKTDYGVGKVTFDQVTFVTRK